MPRNLPRAERREAMMQIYEQVADTSTNPMERMGAADRWLDRVDGKPAVKVSSDITMAGRVAFVIYGEQEKATTDEWQAEHSQP